ncbi:dihydrodipicolinate reductase [Chloroflexota bacterium]
MQRKLRLVQIGLGPIGAKICQLVLDKEGIEIVGACEKTNLGKDVGEIIDLGGRLNVMLVEDVNKALRAKPDIAIHSTVSSLIQTRDQLVPVIKAGVNVVSTCEELVYPWHKQSEIAKELDTLAKSNDVTLLGTGVNPGFCMDFFPIVMTGVCQDVEHIRVSRVQDARSRRLPFQKKIGAGCTINAFEELKASEQIRHVGLQESADMIAAAMGWKIDEYIESVIPIIADKEVSSEYLVIKAGQVAGVEQIAIGKLKGKEIIKLEFRAYLGAPESYDAVYIAGTPNMEVVVKGGIQGDIATASMVVNALPRVLAAHPGLLTMKDLPPVHPYHGDWSALL